MNSHDLKECDPGVIELVLTAATKVHSGLGPGLLESVYDAALAFELARAGLNFRRQVEVPVVYAGHDLGLGFRADFVVADSLLLELKRCRGACTGASCAGDYLPSPAPVQTGIPVELQSSAHETGDPTGFDLVAIRRYDWDHYQVESTSLPKNPQLAFPSF